MRDLTQFEIEAEKFRYKTLLKEATETLTPSGAGIWLVTPNPSLGNRLPIKCTGSDADLQRVLGVLAAIKYGFCS